MRFRLWLFNFIMRYLFGVKSVRFVLKDGELEAVPTATVRECIETETTEEPTQ